jgi:hypothetical protein
MGDISCAVACGINQAQDGDPGRENSREDPRTLLGVKASRQHQSDDNKQLIIAVSRSAREMDGRESSWCCSG